MVEEILLPSVLASSLSLPHEAILSGTTSPPHDDFKVFLELLKRVAADLGVQVEEVRESSHHLFDILSLVGPTRVALPISKVKPESIKALWQSPSSLPSTTKRAERKYYLPSQGFEYLYSHPPLS